MKKFADFVKDIKYIPIKTLSFRQTKFVPIKTIDFHQKRNSTSAIDEDLHTLTSDKERADTHKVLRDKLENHYYRPRDKEASTVRGYTMNSFINHHLHDQTQDPKLLDKEKKINHALDGKAPQNFHVYSGLRESPIDIAERHTKTKHPIGKDIHVIHPAFISSSTTHKVAHNFAAGEAQDKFLEHYDKQQIKPPKDDIRHEHMLKIHIKKGSQHGRYIDHESEHEGEHEFLLKSKRKMTIHHTPETHIEEGHDDGTVKGYKRTIHTHIWHAHLHDDDDEDNS